MPHEQEALLVDLEDYVGHSNEQDSELIIDEDTVQRIASILDQPTQNNIILSGPSGVGKIADLISIAKRKKAATVNTSLAADMRIPIGLIDRDLLILDTNVLFDHDDPENINRDIRRVLADLKRPGKHVLIIKDVNGFLKDIENNQVHGLISSIMGELRKGGFQTIWLVRDEMGRNNLQAVFDCHSDVRELFTVIEKKEPDRDRVLEILRARKSVLENHFEGLTVEGAALEEIVELTLHYPTLKLWTRAQPSRSISLLDRVASTFVTESQTRPAELRALEKERDALIKKHEEGEKLSAAEMERKPQLDSQISQLEAEWKKKAALLYTVRSNLHEWQIKLAQLERHIDTQKKELYQILKDEKEKRGKQGPDVEPTKLELDQAKTTVMKTTEKDIADARAAIEKAMLAMTKLKAAANDNLRLTRAVVREIFSELSGIPTKDLDADESQKILSLGPRIKETVFGQDQSINTVAGTIKAAKAGLKGNRRPLGVFICLGSSGVGKSYMAEVTSRCLFGDDGAITPFDMSEYIEKHTVSQLKGTTPGYAGYGEGGRLTNAVRSRPYQTILLDEVEKAHRDVFKILLQVFNDGRLSDELGTVKFNNTVFFLTTNIGQHLALEGKIDPSSPEGREQIIAALREFFPQEFLNRVDGFLLFNTLQPEHICRIVRRDIDAWNRQEGLVEKGIQVQLSDDDIAVIVTGKYKREEGARQVQRFVENKMGPLLADVILGSLKRRGIIRMHYDPVNDGFETEFIETDSGLVVSDKVVQPAAAFGAAVAPEVRLG